MRLPVFEGADRGLVAGITTRPGLDSDFRGRAGSSDFGLATGGDWWSVSNRYTALAGHLGFSSVAVCRQVHGTQLISVGAAPLDGLWTPGDADGMISPPDGCLLVVTVADCVPVYLFEPETGSLGLLHAGWRGVAAGILKQGIERIIRGDSVRIAGMRVHFGPAICGNCYEVGPEVKRAVGLDEHDGSGLDLRELLGQKAVDLGVSADGVTASSLCTRCDADRFHSHRAAGDKAGRMAAFLGRTI